MYTMMAVGIGFGAATFWPDRGSAAYRLRSSRSAIHAEQKVLDPNISHLHHAREARQRSRGYTWFEHRIPPKSSQAGHDIPHRNKSSPEVQSVSTGQRARGVCWNIALLSTFQAMTTQHTNRQKTFAEFARSIIWLPVSGASSLGDTLVFFFFVQMSPGIYCHYSCIVPMSTLR